jgi:NADH-quinone oxidoreductase subunit C
MPPLNAELLKARLMDELPGALAPTPTRVSTDGHTPPAKKGEHPKINPLATNDPVIHAERLPEVAAFLRDACGYPLLSNITAVDYLAEDVIELVYHFTSLAGGPPLAVKLRCPRDNPEVPSLTSEWPGASLQEREAFDLFGVRFPGHPHLTRVYMWDEFEGFPMRKDFPKQGDKYFGAEDEE